MAPVDQGLLRRWSDAEGKLYPVVMVRPELYELYVRLVRGVSDELASAESVDALAERFATSGGGEELVRQVADRLGISTEGMDVGLLAGAAFAHRYRETLQVEHRNAARTRIREARERGEERVLVYQTGSPAAPPYRRLDMRLADGTGVHSFVELDPETGGPVFGVETLQLDPQTGDWVTEAREIASRQTFADAAEWAEAVRTAGGVAP